MTVRTQNTLAQRLSRAANEFRPQQLFPAITVGLIIGLLEITFAVSFAVLIFARETPEFVPHGIGLMLVAAMIFTTILALFTSTAGVLGSIQDVPAAILSLIAAAIAVAMPAGSSQEELALTIVAAIVVSSLLTGLFFLGLGFLRSGGLVRFLPYPVIGGFLAGSGWLLVTGSISVMAGSLPGLSEIGDLLQFETIVMWLPGLIFAIALLLILNRFSQTLILPAMILAGVAAFYLVIWLSGSSINEVGQNGWLVGPFPEGALYRPLLPSDLAHVYWPAIVGQAGNVVTIAIVSVVALLLNASGIELVFQKDMDLNRELKVAGAANLATGLAGGIVGFHVLSHSALGQRLGVSSRLTGLVTAAVCGLALVAGASVLSLFPRFVVGGLLMFLGLSFLIEWVYEAWFKLPKVDYFIVVMILVVIAFVGFLQGVALGLLATVFLFVLNYSRTNVVKHALSGANFRSRVSREGKQQQILQDKGEELYILQLQGFIFFGTANTLLGRVRRRITDPNRALPRFLLFDFKQVTGLDTTAMLSFTKLRQLAEANDIILVFCNMSEEGRLQFKVGGFEDEGAGSVRFISDADYALEWCENQLLASVAMATGATDVTIEDQLKVLIADDTDVTTLIRYLEPRELEAGQYLMQQGDAPDDLYFIESGQITALLESPDRDPIRLESMLGGQVLGEIGFYLGVDRTASVIADKPSRLYRLTKSQLERMEEENPEAALALQESIIKLLAGRVSHLIETVDALQR